MTATSETVDARPTKYQLTETPPVDFYNIDAFLTPEEREVRDRTRAWVNKEVIPVIAPYWERADFPFELIPKVRELGYMGGNIKGYGCPGMSAVASGLMTIELSRGDASVSTFFGVQSGLAMTSILLCGSEEQRQEWLPKMARLDKIGAFGLTEPDTGSDAAHLQTRARSDGDSIIIDGAKRWIGNGTIADVVVVWARDDAGKVGAYLVEKGTPGFEARKMEGKTALRSVWNADLTFTNCRIPASNRLANSRDFRDTARVLTVTRYGVACGAIGGAIACYEAALAYAQQRIQFGKPLAAFQLIQQKLVWMLAEITSMQLGALRLGQLLDQGQMTPEQASLAKLNNAAKARKIAADARDILGGNGILLENIVARHQADLEAIFTYEGTDHVQTLVVGREITGIAAFV